MQPLLDPPAPERTRAIEMVHTYLADNIRRWRVARFLMGRELSDALGASLAWHLLSRRLLDSSQGETARQRARDELLSTLRDANSGQPRSAMGVALAWIIPRWSLSTFSLRGRIEALERDAHIHAFASRAELRAQRSRTAQPEALVYLKLLELDGEREELLAQALAHALTRTHQLCNAQLELEHAGRLIFSAEELAEARVQPVELLRDGQGAHLDPLFARAVVEARADLLKGWPLCQSLGPWRGRLLAFVLHWFAADLAALEFARQRGKRQPARGGSLRLMACSLASLASRQAWFR